MIDLDRDGVLGAADLVVRIGSADAPVAVGPESFVPGTFLGFGAAVAPAGAAGDDSLLGGGLSETFAGTAGSDRVDGGTGAPNAIGYAALGGPIRFLAEGATGPGAGRVEKPGGGPDALRHVHAVAGTGFDDTLDAGGAAAEEGFYALGLEGRAGSDLLRGNGGRGVQAAYGSSPAAVLVDLAAGTAQDGWGGVDTLVGIRRVAATSGHDDTVLGSGADEVFLSGAGGSKLFDGRGGVDEYRYVGAGAVTIVLESEIVGLFRLDPRAEKPGGARDRLSGIEVAVGGAGNDSLRGAEAEERLAGGPGNDTLDGGTGHDVVFYDVQSAAAGLAQRGAVVDLAAGTATDPWGGTDTLLNLESAWGTHLADEMTGRAAPGMRSFLRGLAGDDTLRPPAAGTMATADHAADPAGIAADLGAGWALDGWGGRDALVAIAHLRGSAFADSVLGGAGANRLEGGGGDDTLDGGAGADTLAGGPGDDLYLLDGAGDAVEEAPGEGRDTIRSAASLYMPPGVEELALAPGAGALFGVGNALANRMAGNEAGNLMIAGDGADALEGGDGNDLLFGQAGPDRLLGGPGVDYLAAGDGDDALDGGEGPDALYGEAGHDLIHGGAGFSTDILAGGAGDDTLDGSAPPGSGQPRNLGDYDRLSGGPGDDLYLVDTPFDLTFEGPGGGRDAVHADIRGAGYYLWAHTEDLVLLGATPFGVGNELANAITGNAVRNWLLGGAGDDTLDGGGGDDVLFGQAGADLFVLRRGGGTETVGDVLPGVDRLRLEGYGLADFAAVLAAARQVGPHVALDLAPGEMAILHDVQRSALTTRDFDLVS